MRPVTEMSENEMDVAEKTGVRHMPTHPLVGAIVVNWNGRRHLVECLASLEKSDYAPSRLPVTVVDNASTDGSQKVVRERFPRVTLLENPRNLGYVEAVNRGVERALRQGADFLWIFNNDVVVYPATLKHLLRAFAGDRRIGVTGPVIRAYEDASRVEHAGYKIDLWTGCLRKLRYGVDIFRDGADQADVDSILGCSNLIRAETWRAIGPFDPVYGLYFEETDFNTRARRKGWRVVLVRDAAVRHRHAATMNLHLWRRAWLLLRNLFIFERRNASRRQRLVFVPYFFLVHVPCFLARGLCYALSVKLGRRGRQP